MCRQRRGRHSLSSHSRTLGFDLYPPWAPPWPAHLHDSNNSSRLPDLLTFLASAKLSPGHDGDGSACPAWTVRTIRDSDTRRPPSLDYCRSSSRCIFHAGDPAGQTSHSKIRQRWLEGRRYRIGRYNCAYTMRVVHSTHLLMRKSRSFHLCRLR